MCYNDGYKRSSEINIQKWGLGYKIKNTKQPLKMTKSRYCVYIIVAHCYSSCIRLNFSAQPSSQVVSFSSKIKVFSWKVTLKTPEY